jgi:hypothetical protein
MCTSTALHEHFHLIEDYRASVINITQLHNH